MREILSFHVFCMMTNNLESQRTRKPIRYTEEILGRKKGLSGHRPIISWCAGPSPFRQLLAHCPKGASHLVALCLFSADSPGGSAGYLIRSTTCGVDSLFTHNRSLSYTAPVESKSLSSKSARKRCFTQGLPAWHQDPRWHGNHRGIRYSTLLSED